MARKVVGVTELCRYIGQVLDYNPSLKSFFLRGEISGFSRSRGHYYFALKDEHCQIDCICFATQAKKLSFLPEDGQEVEAHCRINFYAQRGRVNLIVDTMETVGEGRLFAEFQRLKKRLEAEGLFAEDRKKPLPFWPRRAAVLTSQTGAVIHDMLHVLNAQFPHYDLLLFPCQVQGQEAPASLCRQLRRAAERDDIDVIVIARGGGSFEDLFCFNDESLARCIAACDLPVVSAVGHETDFTICDFVSDRRAPTPTAAAALIYPDAEALSAFATECEKRVRQCMENRFAQSRRSLDLIETRLLSVIEKKRQSSVLRVEDLRKRAIRAQEHRLFEAKRKRSFLGDEVRHLMRRRTDQLRHDLKYREAQILPLLRDKVKAGEFRRQKTHERCVERMKQILMRTEAALREAEAGLKSLHPDLILDRGFAYVTDREGKALRSLAGVEKGASLRLHFRREEAEVELLRKYPKETPIE